MTYLTQSIKALGLAVALVLPALAYAAGEPAMVTDGVLTDHKGMTLYTFEKDKDGKSACNAKCAENWPPLMAESAAMPSGHWTVITRDDGSSQWAYDGKPLYTFVRDTKAGEMTGDGLMEGAWKVAKPKK
jgi:predicted lipoprotein with Yx(FWY)xxD motif